MLPRAESTVMAKPMEADPSTRALSTSCAGNRVYLGEAVHKGTVHPGEHEPLITQEVWDRVHTIFAENHRTRSTRTRAQTPALLKGLIRCSHCDSAMTPSHTKKQDRLYRYYLCSAASKNGHASCPVRSVAAGEIETAVLDQLRTALRTPEVAARTWLASREDGAAREREIVAALQSLDPVWDELFPAEQSRIVQLLVARVDVHTGGIALRLRADGLDTLIAELTSQQTPRSAAE